LLVCADDAGALELRDAAPPGVSVKTYGLSSDADWRARDLRPNELGGFDAEVWTCLADGSESKVADLRLSASSGYSVLDQAALASVKTWLFDPGTRGGERVEMWVKVPVRFQLE
jgi:TonB family protein